MRPEMSEALRGMPSVTTPADPPRDIQRRWQLGLGSNAKVMVAMLGYLPAKRSLGWQKLGIRIAPSQHCMDNAQANDDDGICTAISTPPPHPSCDVWHGTVRIKAAVS